MLWRRSCLSLRGFRHGWSRCLVTRASLGHRATDLLRKERDFLDHVGQVSSMWDVGRSISDEIRRAKRKLDELFLVVLCGEFSVGKSSVINALLGGHHLDEGVLPTTSSVHMIVGGDVKKRWREPRPEFDDHIEHVQVPVPWLQGLAIADTPGVNSVIERHQLITETFIPESDAVLFVTSVERPFSASERKFLSMIERWKKKVVVVVNKADLLVEPEDREAVRSFVKDGLSSVFKSMSRQQVEDEIPIFLVSSRLALKAKIKGITTIEGKQLWEESKFGHIEDYLGRELTSAHRIRIKLESPLGVVENSIRQCQSELRRRMDILFSDEKVVERARDNIEHHKKDAERDFQSQLAIVDNVMHEMIARGVRFFEELSSFSNAIAMFTRKEEVRLRFEKEVIGDTSAQIERRLQHMVDWMIEKRYREWKNVTHLVSDHLNRSEHDGTQVMSSFSSRPSSREVLAGEFDFNRRETLQRFQSSASRVVETFDKDGEFQRFSRGVQSALISSASLGLGAFSLGAASALLLPSTVLDVTGIMGASALALISIFILPARRRQLKRQFEKTTSELRLALRVALHQQFEDSLHDSVRQLDDSLHPFSRFVNIELARAAKRVEQSDTLLSELRLLQKEISSFSGSHDPGSLLHDTLAFEPSGADSRTLPHGSSSASGIKRNSVPDERLSTPS